MMSLDGFRYAVHMCDFDIIDECDGYIDDENRNYQKIAKLSIAFLKEHTIIKETLYSLLSFTIPIDLINMIINYTVEKANPQKVLEISSNTQTFSINNYTIEQLQEFIYEGWDINALGEYHQYYYDSELGKTTPFLAACENEQHDLMDFYSEHGADAYIKNEMEEDFLEVMTRIRFDKQVESLENS